ncbi:MAG: hypothetical protein J0M09_10160 [Xanthomonadales bacterium]|nr:hypothetical protein [Xanthomonadales bacterium]
MQNARPWFNFHVVCGMADAFCGHASIVDCRAVTFISVRDSEPRFTIHRFIVGTAHRAVFLVVPEQEEITGLNCVAGHPCKSSTRRRTSAMYSKKYLPLVCGGAMQVMV